MTAPTGRITVSIEDGIASVEIDDPPRRNALSRAMCIALEQLMPRLDEDPDVVVVALRGAGSTFSAGAAISELGDVLMDPQADGSRIDHLSRADRAIAAVAKPTIAMVDGACMGGGWQIASACDFIVASERAVFAITPAKIGVIYPRAGIERLVRAVGPATAKLLLLTGRAMSAAEARDLGLVSEVASDAAFDARCAELTRTLLSNSRFSMHALKSLVDRTMENDPRVDAVWDEAWAAMAEGPDMPIGVDAFLHHRRPQFSWRP